MITATKVDHILNIEYLSSMSTQVPITAGFVEFMVNLPYTCIKTIPMSYIFQLTIHVVGKMLLQLLIPLLCIDNIIEMMF